jgi:transposase
MEAYPQALRKRIIDAYDRGDGSIRGLARLFDVTPSTVQRYLRRRNREGSTEPRTQSRRGPAPLIDASGLRRLRALVAAQNDRTVAEYIELYAAEMGVRVSASVMTRALQRADLRRKKRASTPANRRAPT